MGNRNLSVSLLVSLLVWKLFEVFLL